MMADNRFVMSSSFSVPSFYGRERNLSYFGSEETFNRLPGTRMVTSRRLVDKMTTLEVENAELRQAVANLRIENSMLRTKLLQESEKRGKLIIILCINNHWGLYNLLLNR